MKYKEINAKKSKYSFYIGIGIFLILVIIATALCMNALWNYLETYEKSTVNYALDEYVEMINQKQFDEIYQNSGFKETEFVSKQDYIENLSKRYNQKLQNPSFLKIMDKNPNKLLYEIQSNGKKIDTVSIVEKRDSQNRKWVVMPEAPEMLGDVVITAPKDVIITVNGKELNDSYLVGDPTELKQFSGIKDKKYTPTVLSYKISGFIEKPKVLATSKSGASISLNEDESGNYNVASYATDEKQEPLKKLALEAAQAYAEYITRDATREKVLSFVYKNCDFYGEIQRFDNSWYSTHNGFYYENIDVSKAEDFSNGLYSVTVSFDYVVKRYGKNFPFPSKYSVAMIETGGNVMVAGIYPL